MNRLRKTAIVIFYLKNEVIEFRLNQTLTLLNVLQVNPELIKTGHWFFYGVGLGYAMPRNLC